MKSIKLFAMALLLVFSSCNNQKEEAEMDNSVDLDNAKTKVLLLAVWHFDNPGLDKYNEKIDDYFTDKRQAEIDEVLNKLEKFEPNKIFIEQNPRSQKIIDSLYSAYRNDEFKLIDKKTGRNEIYQLGFKLGKRLGLDKINCVDADGIWLGYYVDLIADSLNLDFYNKMEEEFEQSHKEESEKNKKLSISEKLIYFNQRENILKNHDYYNRFAVRVQDKEQSLFQTQERIDTIDGNIYYLRSFDFENIGVDLVAEWYKRNLKIYRNILELSQNQDRILVIFGQGHMHYLNQMIEDHPEMELVDPLDYLK
ncbi:MAG: DUF5694 domain-containing protein [Cytophagales bacterium]